jgi:hypothetical protein
MLFKSSLFSEEAAFCFLQIKVRLINAVHRIKIFIGGTG